MSVISSYLTDQRKILSNFFKNNLHETFSVKQLEKQLGSKGISKSAIYRNLSIMEQEGVLCRVANDGNRELLYQYIDPESCCGIIHLICDKCNETHHLNRHISEMIAGLALENFGFKVSKHKAVIYGTCENCSQIKT